MTKAQKKKKSLIEKSLIEILKKQYLKKLLKCKNWNKK